MEQQRTQCSLQLQAQRLHQQAQEQVREPDGEGVGRWGSRTVREPDGTNLGRMLGQGGFS